VRLVLLLFTVKTKSLEHRCVVHGEQNSLFFGFAVGVLVPAPERDNKGVPLFPVDRLSVDDCGATPPEGMEDRGAGMAMDPGSLI